MTMITRTTKLRWRRRIRLSKRQVEGISLQAEEHIEKHLFKRLARLGEVRRFVFAWVLLLLLLMGYVVAQARGLTDFYQSLRPVPGGVYTEGILGAFTNANPLYSTGAVDTSVSRLVFAGLLNYDSTNHLVGDLADSWKIDAKQTTYTVHLRKNLVWQDGAPLTAADVVFTYQTIQNPDTGSPLFTSWQNITVTAADPQTVVFTLPNVLSSFPSALTNGIVPKHVLSSFPAAELRSINFNAGRPIGAGPFRWETLDVSGTTTDNAQQSITLSSNPTYHGGMPKLTTYIIRTFRDEKQLLASFKNHEINAMVGLNVVPDELKNDLSVQAYNVPLTSETTVFFKNSQDFLKDPKVRQALTMATDTNAIIRGLGYPVIAAREPLLASQIGYDKNLTELDFNLAQANKLLDDAGWQKDNKGFRSKDGKELTLNLYSQSTSEYAYVSQSLQQEWRAIGVNLVPQLLAAADLQPIIASHAYDILLYGIELGNDPDVFAFWDSSQADPRSPGRLNFSEYQSPVADKALEGGRTRTDPALRAAKYRPFLEAWRTDAPAVTLYQPRFLYITRGPVFGFDARVMNTDADRLANVQNWMIRQAKVND